MVFRHYGDKAVREYEPFYRGKGMEVRRHWRNYNKYREKDCQEAP
jgi:hypothetical protein